MRRLLDDVTLSAIEARIREGESQHGAELRFVIEPGLAAADVRDCMTPATRALQVFSELRIWDTEANNGVMLYLLVADHAVEIVADRAAMGGWTDRDSQPLRPDGTLENSCQ